MYKNRNRDLLLRNILFCLLLLLLFSRNVLYAQIQVSPLTSFDSWNIVVLGVRTDTPDLLTSTQRKVSLALRPILTSVIQEVEEHYLSPDEKEAAQKLKKDDAISILSNQIQTLIEKDDINALGNEKMDIWEKRLSTRKARRILEKRLKKVQRLETKNIDISTKLPVRYVEQTKVFGISRITDYRKIAIEQNAHSLIFYEIYTLDPYVIIEIFDYNILSQRVSRVLRTVVNPASIQQMYASLQLSLHTVILGTESASVDIGVQGADEEVLYDARILLNGELIGFGSTSLSAIPAGAHVITVSYKGEQRNDILLLEPKEKAQRTYLFDIEVEDTITVQSTPPNAKVYIDSAWVGATPVVIPKTGTPQQLFIVEPGYDVHRYSLDATSPTLYSVILNPTNPIPLEERVGIARRKFYNAFAMFGFSLAVPIIFNGLYINEVNANSVGGAELSATGQAATLQNQDAFFYSFLGTSVVSAGFAVFTYVRLQKYLDTASEYHTR